MICGLTSSYPADIFTQDITEGFALEVQEKDEGTFLLYKNEKGEVILLSNSNLRVSIIWSVYAPLSSSCCSLSPCTKQ